MSDWIRWEGGEQPVPGNQNVDVKWRGSSEIAFDQKPHLYYWEHRGLSCDIVAYRLTKSPTALKDV
jgi:hypothetical protein